MIQRCHHPSVRGYKNYGGRGISVCAEWRASFANFFRDVGPRPEKGKWWIERIDNNGNYEPGNVEWATPTEQRRNTRFNRKLEIDGESKCVSEWAKITGVHRNTITYRSRAGWSDAEAIFGKPILSSTSTDPNDY